MESLYLIIYLQQRQEVPQNFRRLLTSRLRRLVSQGKLEKVNYFTAKIFAYTCVVILFE